MKASIFHASAESRDRELSETWLWWMFCNVCWYVFAFFSGVVTYSLTDLCCSWKPEPRTACSQASCYKHQYTHIAVCIWFFLSAWGFYYLSKMVLKGSERQATKGRAQTGPRTKRSKGQEAAIKPRKWEQAINGRYQSGWWKPHVFLQGLIFWVGAAIGSQQSCSGLKCIFNTEKTFSPSPVLSFAEWVAKLMTGL